MARDGFVADVTRAGFIPGKTGAASFFQLYIFRDAVMTVVIFLNRHYRDQPMAALLAIDELRVLHLLRRVVPHLRARRPLPVIEAQLQWRQAAAARRRHTA